jgi:hypothetical protein
MVEPVQLEDDDNLSGLSTNEELDDVQPLTQVSTPKSTDTVSVEFPLAPPPEPTLVTPPRRITLRERPTKKPKRLNIKRKRTKRPERKERKSKTTGKQTGFVLRIPRFSMSPNCLVDNYLKTIEGIVPSPIVDEFDLDAEFFEAEEFFSTPPSSGDESLVGLAV